jgi:hypothetical protein
MQERDLEGIKELSVVCFLHLYLSSYPDGIIIYIYRRFLQKINFSCVIQIVKLYLHITANIITFLFLFKLQLGKEERVCKICKFNNAQFAFGCIIIISH